MEISATCRGCGDEARVRRLAGSPPGSDNWRDRLEGRWFLFSLGWLCEGCLQFTDAELNAEAMRLVSILRRHTSNPLEPGARAASDEACERHSAVLAELGRRELSQRRRAKVAALNQGSLDL